jgi:amino acid transporter
MLATGGLVILSSLIAAAAISVGCAGYIADLVPAPFRLLILGVVLLMGLVAAWGVQESLTVAGILTLIEICGLLVIVAAGFLADPGMAGRVGTAFPPLGDLAALQGVLAASLIAFFAFLGFNDMVNVAEETILPERTLPLGIVISLGLVTLIYFLVAFVAVQSVPPAELAQSRAPIGLLFERLTGLSPLAITLIAIVATANGIVIQLIMAARVLYGLSEKRQGALGWLGTVNARTRTPLNATICVTAVVAVLAVFVSLDELAEWASQMVLVVFALVNMALVLVKRRETERPAGVFTVPAVVPVIGAATCLLLLAAPLFTA